MNFNLTKKQKIERACGYNPILKGIVIDQFNNFEKAKSFSLPKHNYEVGDDVKLKRDTIMHGIRDDRQFNFISQNGFIARDIFEKKSMSKYPRCINFYNVKKDKTLADYIDEYSGCSIRWLNKGKDEIHSQIIPFTKVHKEMIYNKNAWFAEQLKESRFMPCLQNDFSPIAFILDMSSKQGKQLMEANIAKESFDDDDARMFVSKLSFQRFVSKKHSHNSEFSDRESHVVYGIPKCFVEGILVNRDYEKKQEKLDMIKTAFPNAYICNLDGKVIVK